MSIPAPQDILESIRSTCQQQSLPVNQQAIDTFILSVSQAEWNKLSQNHGVKLPLKFDSPLQELNLLATLGLLNFLSGYRTALHRLTGRGAWSTILSLVLSAYLSASPDENSSSSILSTQGMISCSIASLASLAQITTHSEKDHETLGPAVKVGMKDEEAFEVLGLLEKVLKETGGVLYELGYECLGEWFKEELCRLNGDSGAMIHSMATTFPAFADLHSTPSGSIYLFKKALWTLNAISVAFSTSSSPPFPLPTNTDQFPVFADNVLPSMLLHLSIIPSTPSSSPTILRASSVYACQLIVQRAKELGNEREGMQWLKEWNEVGLDGYLWSLAKEGERREGVERVQERGTVYY